MRCAPGHRVFSSTIRASALSAPQPPSPSRMAIHTSHSPQREELMGWAVHGNIVSASTGEEPVCTARGSTGRTCAWYFHSP